MESLLQTDPVPALLLDPSGGLCSCNRAFQTLSGYTTQHLSATPDWPARLFPSFSLDRWLQQPPPPASAGASVSPGAPNPRVPLRTRDGRELEVLLHRIPLSAGILLHVVRAPAPPEHATPSSSDPLRHLPDRFAVVDATGTVLHTNPPWETGGRLHDSIPPERQPDLEARLRQVLTDPEPANAPSPTDPSPPGDTVPDPPDPTEPLEYRDEQGRHRTLRLVPLGGGRARAALALETDITQFQRRARKHWARMADEAANRILDNVHFSMMLLDGDGRVTQFNEPLARWAGMDPPRILGSTACEILRCGRHTGERGASIRPECVDCPLRLAIGQAVDEGLSRQGLLFRLPRTPPEDPTTRAPRPEGLPQVRAGVGAEHATHLKVSTAPVRLLGTDRVLVCIEDITEQVRSENALRESRERLRETQKVEAIGRMAGGVAHDFNNLLTAILGHSELALLSLGEDHTASNNVEQINAAAARGAALTSQLLAISRRQMLQRQVFDIVRSCRQMVDMFTRVIGEDIRLTCRLPEGRIPVYGDANRLEQVLMNLFVNARDAMPGGGTLHLSLDRVEKVDLPPPHRIPPEAPWVVRIRVEDDGEGMPEEVRRRIFEPFFTTRKTGTGLGLSVIHGIIQQHEGHISVESQPGEGTSFTILLPGHPDFSPPDRPTFAVRRNVPATGEHILVVEDEPPLRNMIRLVLREQGYTVTACRNLAEARRSLQQASPPPDLVFSDVVLPDGSGVDLAEELTAPPSPVPVLLSSGYADVRSQWSLIQERGWPFLQKPYNLKDLTARIEAILRP